MESSGASLNSSGTSSSHVSPPPYCTTYGGRVGSYRGAPTELQPLLEGLGGAQDNGACRPVPLFSGAQ